MTYKQIIDFCIVLEDICLKKIFIFDIILRYWGNI